MMLVTRTVSMVRRETKTLQGSTDDDQDYDGKT